MTQGAKYYMIINEKKRLIHILLHGDKFKTLLLKKEGKHKILCVLTISCSNRCLFYD